MVGGQWMLFLLIISIVSGTIIPKGLQTLTLIQWDKDHITGSPPTVVAFVRRGDDSYIAVHDIFTRLGDDVKSVRIAEVNCDEEIELCKNFHVRNTPYIAYFAEDTNTTGVESARPYLGKRTEEGLRSFLKKITSPAINVMESAPTVDIMIDELSRGGERVVFLLVEPPRPPRAPNTTFFETPPNPLSEAFRITGNRLRDRYAFANMHRDQLPDVGGLEAVLPELPSGLDPNTSYVARLGLGEGRLAPILLGIPGAKSVSYSFRSMAGLAKERRRWNGGGGGGGPLPDPAKDPIQAGLLAWVHRWKHPLLTNLPRNMTELADNLEGRVVVVAALAGESGETENGAFLSIVENLADTWHESDLLESVFEKLFFCKIKNSPSHANFFSQYKLLPPGKNIEDMSLPALFLLDETMPQSRRLLWSEDVKSEEAMVEWLVGGERGGSHHCFRLFASPFLRPAPLCSHSHVSHPTFFTQAECKCPFRCKKRGRH